jgi:hypothetical protein
MLCPFSKICASLFGWAGIAPSKQQHNLDLLLERANTPSGCNKLASDSPFAPITNFYRFLNVRFTAAIYLVSNVLASGFRGRVLSV